MPRQQQIISQFSEEVNDIITAVPSWIIRSGMTLIGSTIFLGLLLSAIIQYPDIVKTQVKVSSLNAPKLVISHKEGKLIKVLVKDNQLVKPGQILAFLESTANHEQVLLLAKELKSFRSSFNKSSENVDLPQDLKLGELQNSYQLFYQDYLQYMNTRKGGLFEKQKKYLKGELEEILHLKAKILQQRDVQRQEFANSEEDYNAYRILKDKNVISANEFRQQESKYLASKYPLQQTELALMNNKANYLLKMRELSTFEASTQEQKTKFYQALNVMISEVDNWLSRFVISSPLYGKIYFSGFIQENQNLNNGQVLFVVNPMNANFFGEVQIPQSEIGKVYIGQEVLVKLKSYPYEQFGLIHGKITYLSDIPIGDSVFLAKVDFKMIESNNDRHRIKLKPGMIGSVEIITEERSLIERLIASVSVKIN